MSSEESQNICQQHRHHVLNTVAIFCPKNKHFCIYRIKCVALRVIHQYKFRRWVYLTDNCPALKIVQRILFMICIQWIDCVKAINYRSQVSHYMSISLPIALHILYGSFCAVRMLNADLGVFYVRVYVTAHTACESNIQQKWSTLL